MASPPQIGKLAEIPAQIRLAISLHGATDKVRDPIMPINKKYPIDRLFESLETYSHCKKHMITVEYILIKGVNDSDDDAAEIARRVKKLHAKVNLIPYNTVEGLQRRRPDGEEQDALLSVLSKANMTVTLRREKGHVIDAASGLPRLQKETAEGAMETVS